MRLAPIHPGATLLAWLAVVVRIQSLDGGWLAAVVGAVTLGAAAACFGELSRLVRRIRYLLLIILILFAWLTPGDALFAAFSFWSPTREGLRLAFEHGLRLVGVVALVALLLGRGGRDFVVSGLYALLGPLDRLGVARERLAVRLLLVLRYVEEAPAAGSWRDWLVPTAIEEGLVLHVRCCPLGLQDAVLLLVGAAILVEGMV
ncbi:MAG: CbiQ family ECF transporter T component [Rhodocyclaceae bacterium]|jgi:energy-coupling factor transporter transmembrane protein EcfT|nr:CbiQ family ECF transporter T component [Rhodocyclaceae bacterium]